MTLRVAICQPRMVGGGRFQVIMSITRILNEAGIVPDLLIERVAFDLDEIEAQYGRSIEINLRPVRLPRLSRDMNTVLLNLLLRRYQADYDLLINTSNSLAFLPARMAVLTYMFYPRKGLLRAAPLKAPTRIRLVGRWAKKRIENAILGQVYRWSRPNPAHHLVCMTRFTRDALRVDYPTLADDYPLIYPAVDMADYRCSTPLHERERAVVSVGRFTPSKRQLEQIQLAEHLPDLPFHIIGFANASSASYYQRCEEYVRSHGLTNVHLHPDIPYNEIIALLQGSKYFLHSMIKEHFGLTAVQAIAAGCVPIVHDSGGQRESVILPELRYQSLDEVPALPFCPYDFFHREYL